MRRKSEKFADHVAGAEGARQWGMRGLFLGAAALLGLLASCSGNIGGLSDNQGNQPGRPGAGTGGGSGVAATDPGRVTMHRLNRVEYNNTVRDLLGTSSHPADDFPPDDRGDGFDNIADILTLSPLHISVYQAAAQQLVDEAMANATQRALVVTCDLTTGADTCARSALHAFVPRAWRRPVTDAEIESLMTMVALAKGKGDTVEQGFKLAFQAVLLSPNFVFRVELDPTPSSMTPHPLSDYELASRLSYFLWSTMPDDDLFRAAQAKTLATPATLSAQVARMLKSPKAQALVDNFAGQWLYIRKIDEAAPDPMTFPSFDEDLRAAMKTETQRLFSEIAFNGLGADKLLTSDFTFVNDRLAKHYGLPLPGSSSFQRVSLTGNTQRGGFLGNAGILMTTSHPTRTSPVLRGKWVLNELLCQDVPPPPPGVIIKIDMETVANETLRQRLERHRADVVCASCHKLMDPIGFGLENYDGIGAYRTMDGTAPIDAQGQMPDGKAFSGPHELASLLSADPDFPRCAAKKLYTYALGRAPDETPTHLDGSTLQALVDGFAKNGFKFDQLIANLVAGPTFLTRRGDPTAGGSL
jgi:hypothetical protein